MNGRRRRKTSHESGGEGTDTGQPPNTDSARQRIVTEIENMKNQKSDSGITVGHEVETKKNNYVIVREIMKGRMSRVFEVRRSKDSKILAMKAHLPTDTGKSTILRHEAHIYHELSVLSKNLQKDEIRFFNIYDYGECSDGQFLFLTLGGESLYNILSDEKVPNYQTALDLSFQMLNVIEQIHLLGFIHCRIRPHTFVTGLKARERYSLYLVNFSLARMANPTRSETVITRTPPQIFDRYAPRCQHFGLPYHRRDDLESWFYICCDLFHPHFLPWSSDKRLKSPQMAELKEKLMKGELYHRYTVMPKPFQAFAGAINETDGKLPNYNFFKESIMEEAKAKNCSFYAPWEFIPVANLPPVPESQSQTRIEYEFNQCVKNPTTFNFGTEKSRTVLPTDDGKELSQQNSDVQIVLPKPPSKSPTTSPSKVVASNSKNNKNVDTKTKNNESVIVSMTDIVKTPPTTSDSDTKLSSSTSATKVSKPTLKALDDVKEPESKPPTDASSDDDDDEDEEEFKLKSPPRLSENASLTGPILQTFHPKPSSTKESAKASVSTTSTGSKATSSTSGSNSSSSASDTSSGPSLSTNSTASTAVSGNFKKEPLPSIPSSSSSSSGTKSESSKPREGSVKVTKSASTTSTATAASPQKSSATVTPKTDNSKRKKIVAVTTPTSPQPSSSSPAIPASPKKSSIATSACSTASLPNAVKAVSPPKNDSVYYSPSNPALNNNVQNGSTFPQLSSSNVKSFQAHKNDSVYFGVPTDAATPANTSGYLKPHHQHESGASKECHNQHTTAPTSSSTKNESVYFAPK